MQICYELGKYLEKETGKEKTYILYYVVIKGIKVYLKPADATARQLLENELVTAEK